MDMYKKIYEIKESFKKEVSDNATNRSNVEYPILYCRRAKVCLKFYKILQEYDSYYTSDFLDEILDIHCFDKERYKKYKEFQHKDKNIQLRWDARKEKRKLKNLIKDSEDKKN